MDLVGSICTATSFGISSWDKGLTLTELNSLHSDDEKRKNEGGALCIEDALPQHKRKQNKTGAKKIKLSRRTRVARKRESERNENGSHEKKANEDKNVCHLR